ncbi:MAG: DUF2848 family protein [Rhodospirillaceae bacterium]|nr:DUF2848 family protein [Rhodospirillaceae bacterium]
MSSHFLYRPHVRSGGKVYTPDLVIELAWASCGGGKAVAIPVDRLTTAAAIQQPGGEPHGIAAIALVGAGDGPLLTVASLHSAGFDAPALLACAKPISRQAWRLRDVVPHLDRLVLRGWHLTGGRRRPATEEPAGRAASLHAFDDLPPERVLMFAARQTAQPHGRADGFEAELEDPVRGETLSLRYSAGKIE